MATFLAAPVAITTNTGTNSVWRDIDVSADVPSGATGVILLAANTGGTVTVGYRKNGSTDTMTSTMTAGRQYQIVIGVDSNRVFEILSGNVGVNYSLWVIGYFEDDAVFFDNAVSLASLTSSYVDQDITAHVGSDEPLAAIVFTAGCYRFGCRINGSTDDYNRDAGTAHHFNFVGVDAGHIFEARGNQTIYLLGYITAGITWHTNASNRSTATTGSFETVTVTGGGTAYIFQGITASSNTITVRETGQTIDPYALMADNTSGQITVPDVAEQKISGTAADLYELGYFTDVGGASAIPAISSYYRRLRG